MGEAAESAMAPARGGAPGAGRLDYLDGLRATAALYVVVFHAVTGFRRGEFTGAWRLLKRASAFGHEAVAVFIVLSGYCLMLPVVRAGGDRLPRGLGNFVARRAFRLLPPYYAALALSLLLLGSVRVFGPPGSGTTWDDSLPGFGWGPIGSHLLLVHNWFPEWAFQINGPLWSVATEWQIYFFFPLLLLPLRRRFGVTASLVVALALGYAPLLFVPKNASVAIPWYLALFAFGMTAAALVARERESERWLWQRVPWGSVTLTLWGAAFAGGWLFGPIWFAWKPLTDLLLGVAMATLLVHLARELDAGRRSRLTAWLGSRPAVALGHMSYSLYLTHLPVLALCHFALCELELSTGVHALALLALGMPLSLAVGALFYRGIERHFIRPPSLPWRASARERKPS